MREVARNIGRRAWGVALMLAILGAASLAARAQENPYAPALTVNGAVISNYELKQRIIFFSLLQPNSDATTEARKSLIDDRLRLAAAEQAGVAVTPDALQAGMEEFAARANMTAEEFLKAIGQRGVDPETFRDFVEAGVLWRDVARKKFASATKISDREIDRAIAGGIASGGELKVLLSEIALQSGGPVDAQELARRIQGDVTSETGFAAAAALYSKSPTAKRGGQLDWVELSKLPSDIAAQVATLEVGTMTEPITSSGSVLLLFLRDRSVTAGEAVGNPMVDLVRLVVAPGADTARIRAGLDRCEDLMPYGRGLPEEVMQRQTLLESTLPGDVAGLVATLDAGESGLITSGAGVPTVVMLCSRQPASDVPPSREDVQSQLMNQRLGQKAMVYLEALRAEALIVEP